MLRGCRWGSARVVAGLISSVAMFAAGSNATALEAAAGPEILRVAPGGSDPSCLTGCPTIAQAVARAWADLQRGAASAVTISVAAGSYDEHVTISSGPITIQGAGANATFIRGGFSGTVVTVAAGQTVTLTDLAISGGNASGNGGGVSNAGHLTLQRVSVGFNAASGDGGGVYTTGPLEVDDSTIVANQATTRGGGIAAMDSGSSVTLVRDAILGNSLSGNQAGVGFGGGVSGWNQAPVTARDSTFAGNTVPSAGYGGGIGSYFGPLSLVGDTVANNRGGGVAAFAGFNPGIAGTIVAGNQAGDCQLGSVAVASDGYNLDDDGSCFGGSPSPGDLAHTDPRLGVLGDNGGPTKTLAISSNSPAYDAAAPGQGLAASLCSGTDQRGVSRLQRGATRCDIGAFQVGAPSLYVANARANAVTAYAPGATGDATPVLTLAGAQTGLNNPNGIVVDVTGNVFVANTNANAVSEYAPEVTGNAAPIATITGSLTQLSNPRGLARDGAGHLFVTNSTSAVTEYAPSANGNVAPIARIVGSRTRLSNPLGLGIGTDGRLRVANGNGTITVYAAGANGNVSPVSVLSDGLKSPQALAFDASGRVLVSDAVTNSVKTFAATATGSATPLGTLTGATPPLNVPIGLDLDDSGNVFVANAAANSVTEYGQGAQGAASPLARITGADTGLSVPTFLAELPPGPYPNITVGRVAARASLRRILRQGLTIAVRARGRLSFRSAPLAVTGTLRIGATTIATGRRTMTTPGDLNLTLLPAARAPRRLKHPQQATLQLTFRHAAEARAKRLPVRLTP